MTKSTRFASAVLSAAAALAGSLCALQASAQVQITTGGIEVRQFLPRTSLDVYAAGYGAGLYRSVDGGAGWSRIALPNNVRYLTSIAGNASGYFIIGAMEGLVSTPDGTTFTQVVFEPVSAVAVAPTGTVSLAAVKGVGILRSTDSGASYSITSTAGFSSLDITSLAFDPSNASVAYAGVRPNNAGTGGGVFRSTDGGQNWTLHNTGLAASDQQISSVVVDSAGNAYAGVLRSCDPVYATGLTCDGAGDVFRSAGGTGSWTASGDLFGTVSLHRDTDAGTTIWVGSRGLGLLSGSGSAFTYAFNNTGSHSIFYTGVNAVATLPGASPVVLKALKGAGVWRSTVAASPRTDWTRVMFPGADRVLSASNVGSNAAPTSMLAGLHAGGVWRTSNNGVTWTPPTENPGVQNDFAFFGGFVNHFISIWELAASATNANLAYAASGGVGMFYLNDATGLFRWNGTAWQGIGSNDINNRTVAPWFGVIEPGTLQIPSEPIYGVSLNRADDNRAYASFLNFAPGIRYRNGGTWSNAAVNGVITPQTRGVVTSSNANILLALAFDDRPARSTDGGFAFNAVTVSQFGFERLRFFGAAEYPLNGSFWLAATNKGIFRSADQGATWSRVNMAGVFDRQAVAAIGYRADGNAFAADFEGNRYCSNNTGTSWVKLPGQLRAGVNAIRNIGPSGNNLYYLTDGAGIFREDGTC